MGSRGLGTTHTLLYPQGLQEWGCGNPKGTHSHPCSILHPTHPLTSPPIPGLLRLPSAHSRPLHLLFPCLGHWGLFLKHNSDGAAHISLGVWHTSLPCAAFNALSPDSLSLPPYGSLPDEKHSHRAYGLTLACTDCCGVPAASDAF